MYALRDGKADIEDWNGFAWGGTICFRYDHIMLLADDELYKLGRKFPPIYNSNGEEIVNENGAWLENTKYIEDNYTEYAKISLERYIYYCKEWVKILKKLYGL